MTTETEDTSPLLQLPAPLSLSAQVVEHIIDALEDEQPDIIRYLTSALHAEDVAELINQLSTAQREALVDMLGECITDDVLANLDADAAEDVIAHMGAEKAGEAFSTMDRDDALSLLEDLPQEAQQEILQAMDSEAREDLEQSFTYAEASAGRLMQKRFVSVPEFWTVGNAIDYLREQENLPDIFYVIYVVDHRFHPCGILPLSKVMQSGRDIKVSDIMSTSLHVQHVNTDQEEVAHVFRKYGLVEAPVVNHEDRLVGTITVDDVVFVIQEEGEEDFLKSAGLQEQDVYHSALESVKSRFPWLFVNLLTAMTASAIIDLYDKTIEKLVLLAVLMPIIASMGGNAGIQSSTVTVRALATRKLATGNLMYMLRKEAAVGALNGIGLGLVTGCLIALVYQDIQVAMIFATAITLTMIIAGLSGAGLPFLLQKLGVDPAVAAGVFLTMLTDIVGFLTFLGLATWILM